MSFLATKTTRSPINFLVLEEDSPNLEGLLFRVDFLVFDLGDGLEELSLPVEYALGFRFNFGFFVDV